MTEASRRVTRRRRSARRASSNRAPLASIVCECGQGLHPQREVVADFGQCAFKASDGFDIPIVVAVCGPQQVSRLGPQWAWLHIRDGLLEDGHGSRRVAGGEDDAVPSGFGAQGCHRRVPVPDLVNSAAAAGAPRLRAISAAVVERLSVSRSPLVAASARCRACSSGSVDDVGQSPVHVPTPRGTDAGVDALSQQGWVKHIVCPLIPMIPWSSASSSRCDDVVGVCTCGARDKFYRGCSGAGGGQQYLLDLGVEAADPCLHQPGQGARQRCLGQRCVSPSVRALIRLRRKGFHPRSPGCD